MEIADIYGLTEIKKAKELKKSINNIIKQSHFFTDEFIVEDEPLFIKSTVVLNQKTLQIRQPNSIKSYTLKFWSVYKPIYQEDSFTNNKQQVGFTIAIDDRSIVNLFHNQKNIRMKWKNALLKIVMMQGFYDDYKPIKKLGEGKSAEVYLAYRTEDNKKFAVKAFSKTQIDQSSRLTNAFENQVQILRNMNNKYIIKAYGCYQTDKSYYIISDYIEGRTLKQLISKEPITYQGCRHLIYQLSEGLKYLAKKGIAHRDLKPDNIMISKQDNKPIILDFGLATKCQSQYIFKRCGTPGYVAPEILRTKGTIITPLVDIFSLGIIFHLLLLRTFPYEGKSLQEIIKENQRAEFNFRSLKYSHFPNQVCDLLEAMLTSDENKRITAIGILKHFSSNRREKENKQNYYIKLMINPHSEMPQNLEHSQLRSIGEQRKLSLRKKQPRIQKVFKNSSRGNLIKV